MDRESTTRILKEMSSQRDSPGPGLILTLPSPTFKPSPRICDTSVPGPSVMTRFLTLLLLPALPRAWEEGEVKELCARGGFVIDMKWKRHRLAEATLLSNHDGPVSLVYEGKIRTLSLRAGERKTLE